MSRSASLGPFEPRLLRLRKRRARAGFADAAFLHARAAADLADRLEAIPRRFERVLALGGGGQFSAELARRPALSARIGAVLEADIAEGDVHVDLERLAFADVSFDLAVSPLALHWANDLPGALIQLRRALKPDGLLLASLLGGATLQELRLCLLEAETECVGGAGLRVSPFAQLEDIASLLQRSGFALPAADREVVKVRYGDAMRLLADLRAMGETAALCDRPKRYLSRRILARTLELYREKYSEADGRVVATFEFLTATGWAPDESQPKPLRPGSATIRLADALGVAERGAGEKTRP